MKEKLINNSATIGSWLTLGNSGIAEIMCQAGFEWITVDMEHSAISMSEAQHIIRTIDLCGVTPVVRVGANDPLLIKRVLDAGAKAIIVPMVKSKEEAIAAVSAVKYPPEGTRGVGLARAQEYGFGFEKYKKWNEQESVVIAQIEHIDAVNDLENILQVKGIDATIIGPYDLSGSIGHPGDFEHQDFIKAIEKYESASKEFNIPMGYHVVQPDIELTKQKITQGYKFLAVGVDEIYLGKICRETINKIVL